MTSVKRTPLSPADRMTDESIVGIYPLTEEETTDAAPVFTVDRVVKGTRLTLPVPRGPIVQHDPAPLLRELNDLFGGWFTGGVGPFVRFHATLESQRDRDALPGTLWSSPATAFYELSFVANGIQVQALGDRGQFHAVFLGRELPPARAIGDGGHLVPQPAGWTSGILSSAAPRLSLRGFRDRSAAHAPNVFDVYLERRHARIKAGVRAWGSSRYFQGVRVYVQP